MHRAFALWACCLLSLSATEPDASTKRWWSYTQALAGDKLEGRDTGSAGYRKAEDYVIEQFRGDGLQPAGTEGFRQPVAMHSVRLAAAQSEVRIERNGRAVAIPWFRALTIAVRANLPEHVDAPLYFVGDPQKIDPAAAQGQVLVTLGLPRIRAPHSPAAPNLPEGSAATVTIDSLGGPEPPIWPLPYAVAVSLADAKAPATPPPAPPLPAPPAFRLNPDAADTLLAGSGHTYAELKKQQEAGKPMPNFAIPGRFQATLRTESRDLSSDNILAVLPGSDPALKDEYVVLSAHLDGYGIGEARHGDSVYNGAFDDAAYVALLLDLAKTLHDSGKAPKRSLLFCIVTGEEKGLLGSRYFAAHPTIAKDKLVADLNLDQVRAIFPLTILTTLALTDSTLGEAVQQVAQPLGIHIQADPEPERNLLRRSDHFSFMQIGIPAVNFVFGYRKGSAEEKVYRQWYAERYHSPADDLAQPWVPAAAAKFSRFYSDLVQAVANAPERPQWKPDSQFFPHTN